tara:strand:- start:363 stop:1571 length:1209 start_codon:yes stop_codon:yes gene_type:complete
MKQLLENFRAFLDEQYVPSKEKTRYLQFIFKTSVFNEKSFHEIKSDMIKTTTIGKCKFEYVDFIMPQVKQRVPGYEKSDKRRFTLSFSDLEKMKNKTYRDLFKEYVKYRAVKGPLFCGPFKTKYEYKDALVEAKQIKSFGYFSEAHNVFKKTGFPVVYSWNPDFFEKEGYKQRSTEVTPKIEAARQKRGGARSGEQMMQELYTAGLKQGNMDNNPNCVFEKKCGMLSPSVDSMKRYIWNPSGGVLSPDIKQNLEGYGGVKNSTLLDEISLAQTEFKKKYGVLPNIMQVVFGPPYDDERAQTMTSPIYFAGSTNDEPDYNSKLQRLILQADKNGKLFFGRAAYIGSYNEIKKRFFNVWLKRTKERQKKEKEKENQKKAAEKTTPAAEKATPSAEKATPPAEKG